VPAPEHSADVPTSDAGRVWWARVDRAAERRGLVGRKVMADWSHAMMRVQVPDASGFGYELVDARGRPILESEPGCRRAPITTEQFTDEHKQRETRRLCDELGRTLGVGPMPL
jgi:hypothetical protein